MKYALYLGTWSIWSEWCNRPLVTDCQRRSLSEEKE